MSEDAPTQGTITEALAQLTNADLEVRERAIKAIQKRAEGPLHVDEVSAILQTASEDLPLSRYDFQPYDAALLIATWRQTRVEHLPAVTQQFPKLSPLGRTAALAALAWMESQQATRIYVQLLRDYGWPERSYSAMTFPFERSHQFAEDLLPAFVDGSISGLSDDIRYGLLLAVPPEEHLSSISDLMARWREHGSEE